MDFGLWPFAVSTIAGILFWIVDGWVKTSLQQPLFLFFLTTDAVLRPRHRFQPLLLHLFLAVGAGSVFVVTDALQRFVNQVQNGAVRVGLPEQEFLGVRIRCLVGKIHSWIVIRLTAFLFSARDRLHQFIAPRQ